MLCAGKRPCHCGSIRNLCFFCSFSGNFNYMFTCTKHYVWSPVYFLAVLLSVAIHKWFHHSFLLKLIFSGNKFNVVMFLCSASGNTHRNNALPDKCHLTEISMFPDMLFTVTKLLQILIQETLHWVLSSLRKCFTENDTCPLLKFIDIG